MESLALAKKFLICLIFATSGLGELWMLTRASAAKEPLRVPDEILSNLRTGDLVFRLGDVTDSRIIATATDFKYSHVGMIVRERPLLVVHAVTGEGGLDGVAAVSMREFLAHARDFGAVRMKFLSEEQKARLAVSLLRRVGESFTLRPRGEANLYCTTLLEQEISKITEFSPQYFKLNLAVLGGEYLAPKAFWHYGGVEILYER
ncbi:YiiX/YebB-like N1pC/P60 family cysteine hydrolase [uncultured Campylobacter sp.]|uniref:YiiX/YebB-like N1pC/P60 family cysteine hydrolase n=1 Tax=uncultured Campylobacter sp. TaxID=218934 RepID=UPI00262007FB|nr:YiiX/YebB-like N1pC/P60 family cysteine hydrolase [uncultured Campylobacter sp.]